MGVAAVHAYEMQTYLTALRAERELALHEGFSEGSAYMVDLDDEIAAAREAYTGAAVTELASFRGELYGRQEG